MREKITIKSDGNSWKMIIPGFGFNPFVEIKFTKWSDAIDYLNWQPQGSSSSFERASNCSDGIATVAQWSPLQRW